MNNISTNRWRHVRLLAAIALLGGGLGCNLVPTEPAQVATYQLIVDARAAGTGGVRLSLASSLIQEIEPADYADVLAVGASASSREVIVVGAATVGTRLLSVRMARGAAPPAWTVVEAAAGQSGGYAQLSPGAYQLSWEIQR